MHILLTENHTVAEIIPDENPVFPGIPVSERYAPDFVEKLLHVPDGTAVEQNWVYDEETGTFHEPLPPEPVGADEAQPSIEEEV